MEAVYSVLRRGLRYGHGYRHCYSALSNGHAHAHLYTCTGQRNAHPHLDPTTYRYAYLYAGGAHFHEHLDLHCHAHLDSTAYWHAYLYVGGCAHFH
jgi:hypothetical protein